MGDGPKWKIEWLGRCDWAIPGTRKTAHRQWGAQRHRKGFTLKLGGYGMSVWNPWVRQ